MSVLLAFIETLSDEDLLALSKRSLVTAQARAVAAEVTRRRTVMTARKWNAVGTDALATTVWTRLDGKRHSSDVLSCEYRIEDDSGLTYRCEAASSMRGAVLWQGGTRFDYFCASHAYDRGATVEDLKGLTL